MLLPFKTKKEKVERRNTDINKIPVAVFKQFDYEKNRSPEKKNSFIGFNYTHVILKRYDFIYFVKQKNY